jgi:hypothetical protein
MLYSWLQGPAAVEMQKMIRLMVGWLVLSVSGTTVAQEITSYVRYEYGENVSCGVLEEETIHELRSDIFTDGQRSGNTVMLGEVRLLITDADSTAQGHRGRTQLPQPPGRDRAGSVSGTLCQVSDVADSARDRDYLLL